MSRYPLFAARRHLILLVAHGVMAEDDRAWRSMYRFVNELLASKRRLDMLGCFLSFVRYHFAIGRDELLARKIERELELERRAAKSIPQFGEVRREVGAAFRYLVHTRTTSIGAVLTLFLILCIVPYAVARVLIPRGLSATRQLLRKMVRPSTDDVAGFRAWRHHHCAA